MKRNELAIAYHIFSDLKPCPFFKKGAGQQPCHFHKPSSVYEIYNGKIFQIFPAFKLCDVLECPNELRFKNRNNYLGEIDDQIN